MTYFWDLNSWFLLWLGCLRIKQLLWCKCTGTMKTFNFSFLRMKKGQLTEYMEYVTNKCTCWNHSKVGCQLHLLGNDSFLLTFSHCRTFGCTKNPFCEDFSLLNFVYDVLENWPPWTFRWMELRIISKEVGNIPQILLFCVKWIYGLHEKPWQIYMIFTYILVQVIGKYPLNWCTL